MDEVFTAFCDAGLWPTLGRSMTARLSAAGITSPAAVSVDALVKVEGLGGPKRAEKLAKTFVEAQPRYAVAELLYAADTAYAPYGDRSEDFLCDRSTRIARFLCDQGAQMIVVGNRGMAGARRVLGSVPNRVSHQASCGVLIVPTC